MARKATRRRTKRKAAPRARRSYNVRASKPIGQTMTKRRTTRRKPKLMNAAIDGALTGLGFYLGQMGANAIPGNRMLAGGAAYAGGIALSMMGLPVVGNGVAGAGFVTAGTAAMGQLGVNVAGIGARRRSLTPREIKMIEAAAGTDGVRGLTDETLHGSHSPIRTKRELI